MTTILEHPDGQIEIADLTGNKRRITIHSEKYHIPEIEKSIETFYPIELIKKVLDLLANRSQDHLFALGNGVSADAVNRHTQGTQKQMTDVEN